MDSVLGGNSVNHYPSCEKAASRKCECRWCCGSLHGWTGAVRLARQPGHAERDDFHRQAESKWQAAFAGKTRPKPSLRKKSAGIDLCRADIIDWLARDRSDADSASPGGAGLLHREDHAATASVDDDGLWQPDPDSIGDEGIADELRLVAGDAVVDQLETAAEKLLRSAVDDIAREFGGRIPDPVKVALADHVWCGLLAELAHVLDEGLKLVESVPDRVVDLVMKTRKEARWRHVEEKVLRIAARSLWSKVRLLTFFGVLNRKVALPVIRMLAVLSCKAPERHRAVVEYCIDPLGKQLLAETKGRLKAVLSEWLPHMSARPL